MLKKQIILKAHIAFNFILNVRSVILHEANVLQDPILNLLNSSNSCSRLLKIEPIIQK